MPLELTICSGLPALSRLAVVVPPSALTVITAPPKRSVSKTETWPLPSMYVATAADGRTTGAGVEALPSGEDGSRRPTVALASRLRSEPSARSTSTLRPAKS